MKSVVFTSRFHPGRTGTEANEKVTAQADRRGYMMPERAKREKTRNGGGLKRACHVPENGKMPAYGTH